MKFIDKMIECSNKKYTKIRIIFAVLRCYMATAISPFLGVWELKKVGTWEPYFMDIFYYGCTLIFTLFIFNKYVNKLVKHYKLISNIALVFDIIVYSANLFIQDSTFFYWSTGIYSYLITSNLYIVETMIFNKFFKNVDDKTIFNTNLDVIEKIAMVFGVITGILLQGNYKIMLLIYIPLIIIDNREGYIACTRFDENGQYIDKKNKK